MSKDEKRLKAVRSTFGTWYYIDGKVVSEETWRRYLHGTANELSTVLARREGAKQSDNISRELQSVRNELVHNVFSSGVSAAAEFGSVPPPWFKKWAETDTLPDAFAQGQLKVIDIIERRENTWLSRAKKAFWYVVGIIATAIVTYYVALAGFKI